MSPSPSSERRYDLDTLRVGAFMLLILYHLGMFYVPWGWHVKSTHILPGLVPFMEVVNPWRLTLLFVISGAATGFMAGKLPTGAMFRERSRRLLAPLAFGMAVIVAPQTWAEVVEKHGYAGSFLDFWPRYLSFDDSFGIIMPTYNHLWFVAYLWIYTAAALALRPLWPRIEALLARIATPAGVIVAPALAFVLIQLTAGRAWEETHIFWADGYAHLHYGLAFLLGLGLARQDAAWDSFQRTRWIALGAAAVVGALGLAINLTGLDQRSLPASLGDSVTHAIYAWCVIAALFGFARRHIRQGSPRLTMLTEAVFPFYIVHQTTIVLTGHALKGYRLPAPVEAGLILTATAASCWAAYEIARRVRWLRLPMGLKPLPRPEREAAKLVDQVKTGEPSWPT
ncbi:MAG TPA: acyltransferase family protein [Phenylobacterium sp.]